MEAFKKRKWLAPVIIGIVLLLGLVLVIVLLLRSCQPTSPKTNASDEYTEGQYLAEIAVPDTMSDEERYAAYDHDNDPAHPVLDEKVELSISNLGSKPGEPRPQDIATEYPMPTPSATPKPKPTSTPTPPTAPSVSLSPSLINPGLNPGLNPGMIFQKIELPELYILAPDMGGTQDAGERYTLNWEYTAGRKVVFAVSISGDGGESFIELVTGIEKKSYELRFPDAGSEHCILRVTALLGDMVYMTADTNEFALEADPEPGFNIVENYVDPQVQYVDIPGLRISRESRLPVWFNVESHAENADKLIWQLSTIPFFGTKELFGQEKGIIASGELESAGEFSIDLNALCEELSKPDSERGVDKPFLFEQSIYELYLRVVPLDKDGECIGDPGRGVYFTYGVPDIQPYTVSAQTVEIPEIQLQVDVPYYWEYRFERINPGVLNRNLNSKPDEWIRFMSAQKVNAYEEVVDGVAEAVGDAAGDAAGAVAYEAAQLSASKIIGRAVQVELQVATSPFTNDALGLAKPQGLVYSYLDTAPDIYTDEEYGNNYCVPAPGLDYKKFALSKDELDVMGGIYYYVRAVFYVTDSENPSVLRPYPSETMTVAFRVADASKNEVKTFTVKSDIPYVQFLEYGPAQWQHPNYDEYFEVARRIEAQEMNFDIEHDGTYIPAYNSFEYLKYLSSGGTEEQYQALLDEMLQPGSVIHYVKAKPGFWDEFFGLLNAIYNGVSNAYANAKASVVSLVDYIPLIGPDARGFLKAAATYAIDYGLMSIGLPPSLPNVDQLAEGGMDYLIKVGVDEALKAANIPPDSPGVEEITEGVRQKVAEDLAIEFERAVLAQQQNPLRASFLRLELKKLYVPAYVDVFVCNYSQTRTTRAGKLGFSSGSSFDVYESQCVIIPSLKPGEHMVIRMYLDHLRNKYVGYGAHFDELYYGKSGQPYEMGVGASFDLPDVRQTAKEQGIAPAPLPYVTEYVYDHEYYSYSREFVPAEWIYTPDFAPNAQDFLD